MLQPTQNQNKSLPLGSEEGLGAWALPPGPPVKFWVLFLIAFSSSLVKGTNRTKVAA